MNTEWAIAELDTVIKITVMRNGSSSSDGAVFITTADYTAFPDAEVTKQAPVVERILDRVIPRWRSEVPDSLANNRWSRHREAAIHAREQLMRQQEIDENLGENAPKLSAAELHPWTWSGASSLWRSGHFREAVGCTIKKLNSEKQNKLGRRDVSETDLFKQAFSMDEPKAGMARFRCMKDDGSHTYQSVPRAAISFAEGIFASIRNPLTHEPDQELAEHEALEYLAALSVLARWVDTAEVEAAS
ncbi:TIGR02391 family protein [Saccharopolyspora sp. NPDC047091]|uniref:TIGR02391 family protein n=1 Tax=Saccharopolyspora sp. NPDC047091 TaxID=3155924 RepID=UPI0033CB24B2